MRRSCPDHAAPAVKTSAITAVSSMIPESTRAGSNLVPNGTRLTTVPVISPGKKRNQKENKGSRSSTRGQVFCPACPLNPSLQRAIDILLAALHPSAPLKIVPSYYTTSARIPLLSLKKLERFANECSALKMRQPDAAPPHSDPLPSKGGGRGDYAKHYFRRTQPKAFATASGEGI